MMLTATALSNRILKMLHAEWKRIRLFSASCGNFLKMKLLGAEYRRTLMSRIRYSPKSTQGTVARMVFCTNGPGELERQPERGVSLLEWQAVEPELEFARQSFQLQRTVGPLPKLASFSSAFWRRSFFLQSFYPSSQHLPGLVQMFRDCDILFIVERLQLPGDLQKEFKRVEFDACFLQIGQFLLFLQIACGEKKFDYLEKKRVDFPAERIAGFFGEVILIFVP